MSLDGCANLIEEMNANGMTAGDISAHLCRQFGAIRGFSDRNVRRWISERGLSNYVRDDQLQAEVASAAAEVGPTYGRKMMTGLLSSKGIRASERRVGATLQVVHPQHHEARQHGARNLNPVPYRADFFGQKLHIDQNEKLVMFGVTHVVAIDGYSGQLVGHSTMAVKNNLKIYEEVYREAVMKYGLWDQLRAYCGTEFYLSLFMQEKLSGYRYNTERPAFLQTPSTSNHRIERISVEINNRVNYKIKASLTHLQDQEVLSMQDEHVRFCVSALACQVASVGISRFIDSWNAHRVPGRGIPNVLASGGCPVKIPENLLPFASVAADWYDAERGSSLTRVSGFGVDPFMTDEARQQAGRRFSETFGDINPLFDGIANDNSTPFLEALQHLISVSSE